ncbi:sensor histidine kinase [Glycomyces algeriensis]|uniref:histidine kinase n=1 Tax=Glycomyces algeriensis TaxID=256037 RepID=A0A9W6G7I8_9ACTN|nr:histidine kinase [Glycomyces algeriensis]MDA1365014.1 histidine kinase [Glycomyces algeriensis]MDR7349925.1 signal transduction histidine kinase [Glycomyces algeriensis]GLI42635.1 two-component sensor histidine kinase [Glycomyces algeriensis]
MTSPPRRSLADRFRGVQRPSVIAAVLLFALGSALLALGSYERFGIEVPQAVRFIPLVLVCTGVVLRRTWPGMTLALGLIGFGAEIAIGFSLAVVFVFTDNLYAYARYGSRRGLRIMVPAAVAAVLATGVYIAAEDGRAAAVLSMLAIAALVLVSPIFSAIIVRQAHERAALETERAEQTARLADVRRREAVLRERTLMARELHDTVANYLSAIALQSTALQARKDLDAETVRTSVAAIRSSSVEGLAELRRIIGLLRAADSGAGEELASFRLDQVPELVERMRKVGLDVDFAVEGTARALPGEVELTAYRVVQEALTNVLKYGSDASVAIRYEDEWIVVEVENAVRPGTGDMPSGGAGLVGMTERVRILGGEVRAGPEGRRWRVRAEIPTGGLESPEPQSPGTSRFPKRSPQR